MIVMIDINDSEFLSRIEPKELLDKVCDGKTAAAMIQPGDILGISGFTPCGYPKITMHELAERMKHPSRHLPGTVSASYVQPVHAS